MLRRNPMQSHWLVWLTAAAVLSLAPMLIGNAIAGPLSPSEEDYQLKLLGKFVFFDDISVPARQSCASCHAPEAGGTNENAHVNRTVVAVPGANFHVSGGLKPPTNAYASHIETFKECNRGAFLNGPPPASPRYCGGNFWNGRAEGNDTALFPAGATKHIGSEIFFNTDGTPFSGDVLNYDRYRGPVADQALNPMPNLVEQNIQRQAVCEHVASSPYGGLYELVWGVPLDCSNTPVAVSAPDADAPETAFDISFKRLMLAVCAWQHSDELNSFSSKRDKALREELACACAEGPGSVNYPGGDICDEVGDTPYPLGDVCDDPDYTDSPGKFPLVGLTDQENLGHDLFYNVAVAFGPGPPPVPPFPELPAAQCAFCHISDTSAPDGTGLFERYTDDAYHDIGSPANPAVPAAADAGLPGHIGTGNPGWKTPTLRNVNKRPYSRFVKAYTHNGWFKSMESIVHWYNSANTGPAGTTAQSFGITPCSPSITSERRALRAKCWPGPETGGAVGGPLIGNLGMNAAQEAALVAYLFTLTDEVTPEPPQLSELPPLP